MIALDVNVTGNLAQCGEYLQPIGVHLDEAWAKREVGVHLLEAVKRLVEDLQRALDYRAVLERIQIARMHNSHARTRLRTWPVARLAFAILCCFIRWTRANTGTRILKQMLGTIPDTCRSIRVLSVRIRFPQIVGRIVLLHWRTLLFAHAVIVEIPACQAVLLCGSCASAGAKQVAAIARLRAEATALGALRRAIGFAELLAIVGAFAPAT